MAIFPSVPHSLVLMIFLLAATAAGSKPELATQVCKNTTDFKFCMDAIYSDPRAARADRFDLAYIAFGKAYANATDTRDYIASKVKGGGDHDSDVVVVRGLKRCVGDYKEAVRVLMEAQSDMDVDTYYGLDKLARRVGGCARACERRFEGRSPVAERSKDMIKLANVCYVVSLLFPYYD